LPDPGIVKALHDDRIDAAVGDCGFQGRRSLRVLALLFQVHALSRSGLPEGAATQEEAWKQEQSKNNRMRDRKASQFPSLAKEGWLRRRRRRGGSPNFVADLRGG